MKFKYKNIIKWVVILVLDYLVFAVLGLFLMDYDDFYVESQGEYWSLASMDTFQKCVYILLNLWWLLNFLFLIKILWSCWTKLRKSHL